MTMLSCSLHVVLQTVVIGYDVAVPSLGRPTQIVAKTLLALKRGHVPVRRVWVFIVPEQAKVYERATKFHVAKS